MHFKIMKVININKDSFLNSVEYMKLSISKNNILKGIILFFLVIEIFLILFLNLNKGNNNIIRINSINERRESIIKKQMNPHTIDKEFNEEYKDIQKYIYMVISGHLFNPNEVFKKSENPKISIVISVYNGEGYLETALLSIQNQDFKDIEIIMVDDCSKDNSVNLIKKLMVNDPRIKLYQNDENKGALYTKTKGVLHAKGKYVMTLDEDDIYAQRDAFSTLYSEAEENNLDMLGFALLSTNIQLSKRKIIRYKKTNVVYQPSITKRMYKCNSYNCKRVGGLISNLFIKTELFVKIIKKIEKNILT